jgi:hypothetical protein
VLGSLTQKRVTRARLLFLALHMRREGDVRTTAANWSIYIRNDSPTYYTGRRINFNHWFLFWFYVHYTRRRIGYLDLNTIDRDRVGSLLITLVIIWSACVLELQLVHFLFCCFAWPHTNARRTLSAYEGTMQSLAIAALGRLQINLSVAQAPSEAAIATLPGACQGINQTNLVHFAAKSVGDRNKC